MTNNMAEAAANHRDQRLLRKVLWISTSFVVVCALAASLIFHTAIANQLNVWKLLPEPERLTELYFTQPNNLPAVYTPGMPQALSFTVHNLEYATTAYHYTVEEQDEAGISQQALTSGDFTLRQNEYKTVDLNIYLPDMGPKTQVIVTLTNTQESIRYLVNRRPA